MKFQSKLLLIFIAFFLLVSILMLVFTQQSQKLILKEVRENRQNFANIILISAQRLASIPESEPAKIQQLIDELKANGSVNEITIVDKNGRVVESTNHLLVGQHHPLSSIDAIINERPDTVDLPNEYSPFEISVPLVRDRKITGMVRTTVTLKDIQAPLEALYYKNLAISVLLLLFGLVSSFFVLHRLNKPLQRMTLAAQQIAQGYFSVTITSSRKDEIRNLEQTFNMMSARLAEQKALEKKLNTLEKQATMSEIASYLAHEIRNPLNLIMLTTHHLQRQFVPADPNSKEKYLDMMKSLKSEVEQLDKIISNFIELGKPSIIEKTTLGAYAIFEQLHIMLQQQLAEKNISLRYSGNESAEIIADAEKIKLVFLNIFLNAINAVPVGGFIVFTAGEKSSDSHITIHDNGPGIPAEEIERIFEPYFSRRYGGTGLGLALAKRIVEGHGGTISAANQAYGGARFEIYIPMEKET